MTHLSANIALAAIFVAAACSQPTLRYGLPTRTTVSTENFVGWRFADDSLPQQLGELYFVSLPNEMAACLYGGQASDTLVVRAVEPASVAHADTETIRFQCAKRVSYLGDTHSHPGHTAPEIPCLPSPADNADMLRNEEVALTLILCGNGGAFWQLRDGRFGGFQWFRPRQENDGRP